MQASVKTECRMCGGPVETKLKLKPTPVANDFQDKPFSGEFFPLDLRECRDCGHVQTGVVVDGLYNEYKYRTPKANLPKLEAFAARLKKDYPNAKSVIEIGANNGLNVKALSKYFPQSVIGVDPDGDYPVWRACFDTKLAPKLIKERAPYLDGAYWVETGKTQKADIIIANNVLAHIDDLDEVFRAIDMVLADDGVLIIEYQEFNKMLWEGIYDTIYHEHMDQHTRPPWIRFLKKYDMCYFGIEYLEEHGGSTRLHICRGKAPIKDYKQPIDWEDYKKKIAEHQERLLEELPERFCLWGAPAKATTLIHQLGIADRIAYAVDSTRAKQGRYIPGTGIKIYPDFQDDLPALLGAWNFEHIFRGKYDREYFHPYKAGHLCSRGRAGDGVVSLQDAAAG